MDLTSEDEAEILRIMRASVRAVRVQERETRRKIKAIQALFEDPEKSRLVTEYVISEMEKQEVEAKKKKQGSKGPKY